VPLNLSFTHIVVVLVVALVVLGPERLPEAARSMAKWITEFRRMSHGLQSEVRDTFGEFAEPFSDLVHSVKGGTVDLASTVGSAVSDVARGPAEAAEEAAPPAAPDLAAAQRRPTGPSLPSLPALGPDVPAPGTFSPGPPTSEPLFAPLGTPEPGMFTPRP
jgi:sec-independent protein translocase protein TatB